MKSLNFHFHLPNNYRLVGFSARPVSLWNNNRKLFLTGNREKFTACVEFSIKPRYWKFIIVCGHIDTSSEKPRVVDLLDSFRADLVPWMAIFTDQDPNSASQLAIIDKLKNEKDELRKLREGVLRWNAGRDGCISLKSMSEKPKFTSDDQGEMPYSLSMIMESFKRTLAFNIRVFVSELSGIHETSTLGNARPDEEEPGEGPMPRRRAPALSRPRSPESPSPPPNPFAPAPNNAYRNPFIEPLAHSSYARSYNIPQHATNFSPQIPESAPPNQPNQGARYWSEPYKPPNGYYYGSGNPPRH